MLCVGTLRDHIQQLIGGEGRVDGAVDCVGFEARGMGEGAAKEVPAQVKKASNSPLASSPFVHTLPSLFFKEFKTKIHSHAHSLIFSLFPCLSYECLIQSTVSCSDIRVSHCVLSCSAYLPQYVEHG